MNGSWIRHSEAQEKRITLRKQLQGWWIFRYPFKAWQLYRKLRTYGEEARRAANSRYLAKRMADPALARLNREQRRAVLVQEDRTLVIAGAGTGKTYTMVEKARDTVKSGIAEPSQIAFVTFTRKAAREIQSRTTEIEGMEIGTIHHLARRVIQLAEGRKPRLSPLVEDNKRRFDLLEEWFEEAIQDDPRLLVDLVTRKYAFVSCKDPDSKKPLAPRVLPDEVQVKSMGEALIATTLFLSGIRYKYEEEFPVPERYKSDEGRRYFPDFFLPDDPRALPTISAGIWYEHFANDRNGDLPAAWDKDNPGSTAQYHEDRLWKEKLHSALGTRFMWTEYGDMQRCRGNDASFPDLVLKRVRESGITNFADVSSWKISEVLEQTASIDASSSHRRITFEIDAWIRTSRQQVSLDKARGSIMSRRDVAEEASALFRIAARVGERYDQYLEESDTVDHESVILKAWQYLQDGTVEPPWRVILVDEYQDVNPAQAAFVHAILKPRHDDRPSTGARLTAVGDDWQAIFAFQGGDVDLIRSFGDPAGLHNRYMSRVALKQTYRFGQQLADTTRCFVTQAPGSINREVVGSPEIVPDARWPSSVVIASSIMTQRGRRIFGADHHGLTGAVIATLSRIAEQAQEPVVLILGRRNVDIEDATRTGKREIGLDLRRITTFAASHKIQIEYSTVHKAKGTEGDYVIFLDTGPPRAGERAGARALDRALSVFRGPNQGDDEGRRIWYVALTRARRKAYIIVDAEAEAHSLFADELFHNVGGQYDVGEDELAEYLEPMRPHVPCPTCIREGREGPVLAKRVGPMGSFAGCTSFSAGEDFRCGHTERLCGSCEVGLMIRTGDGYAACQSPNCDRIAPLCRCPVRKPMSERTNSRTGEPFWGCQDFPRGCRVTASISTSE